MKKLSLLLLSLVMVGCLGITPGPDPDKPCTLRHTISYSNQGTRSEARHGRLFVGAVEIPDAFTYIACGQDGYRFYSRMHLWGSDGYFPVMNEPVDDIPTSEKLVGKTVLKRGYYTGAVRFADTPSNWLYVNYVGGSAFVAPDHIMTLLIDLKVPRLYREKRLPFPEGGIKEN